MKNIQSSVSLIIPAYNSENVIQHTVTVSIDRLSKICDEFEVIVSDNGSTDDTAELIKHQADENEHIKYVYEPNPGRGLAVEAGFQAAQGDILCFIDDDLSTNMDHLIELLEPIANNTADLTIGSRRVPGEESDRPLDRDILSRTYNLLVRILLKSSVYDHQIGFKAIKSSVFDEINNQIEADHWFWDTELLVIAQVHGYQIKEFPVKWKPTQDSSVDLYNDVPMMARQILYLALQLRIGTKKSE
jgi:glycosyltransferase involved in cell wall biosynthesis